MAKIAYFECSKCAEKFSADVPHNVCPHDGGFLFVRYDFQSAKLNGKPVNSNLAGMWRYQDVLPNVEPVTLGEGFTPLTKSRRYPNLWIKDESVNPTGSFKARGASMAVTMARHYGLQKLAVPSAGNAAGAFAAYCAAAGIEAHIFVPVDALQANILECMVHGAKLTLVKGLIADCGQIVSQRKKAEGWFEVSTLKEPFRLEGKKTMGYEIAEQMGWILPDVILFPTGGGISLIAMWKAFEEMEALGWINAAKKRPKMIAVQSETCAPLFKAFTEQKSECELWPKAHTLASGLRVPKSYGDYNILEILRKSEGTVICVSDAELIDTMKDWAVQEGIFPSLEGAAAMAGYDKLLAAGVVRPQEKTVLFNTGTGLKYINVLADAMDLSTQQKLAVCQITP